MTEPISWKLRQLWKQSFFIPKPKFTAQDIPDLSGKIIIVTGGNTGIGKETVKVLLSKNAKVYMASRSQTKAEAAIADLEKETGKKAIFLELDLADLGSIKRSAETFQSTEKELHILFNSGGVMIPPMKDLTKQWYDLQFGTNALGHFYFTKLLLPTLQAAAKTSPAGTVRIVTTSSSASVLHTETDIHYDTLRPGKPRDKMGAGTLYAQSKLGNTLVARELARRYADDGIVSITLNPGNIRSDLQRNVPKFFLWIMRATMLYPTHLGAITQLYAGTAPEAADHNGKFLIPWARVGEHTKASNSPENATRLWDWLEAQIKAWEEGQPSSA
ncbi:NAD-P-binding protein [Schizopora paradoxa]|uniref:NAD-P-binding protein n=1 Tax=Schizopora paradoxa TaxID=27342 RepID=A0A0H2RW18_9AGAM|nr:NAD-P-binding protein [Schizopora paradoxa]